MVSHRLRPSSTTSASTAIAPRRSGDDRVEVDLEDVGSLRAQAPERDQHGDQGHPVDRRAAADTAQDPRAAELVEHRLGRRGVERREPDRDVVEDLGQDPAQADQDGRPELRVAAQAHDQLHAGRRHRLDEQAAYGEAVVAAVSSRSSAAA